LLRFVALQHDEEFCIYAVFKIFVMLGTVQKLLVTSTPYKCSYANYFVIRRKSQA